MSDSTTSCPKCGAAIPPEAPQGLCPKCLLHQASFPTETGAATRHSRPAPPAREDLAAAFPHLQILELIGQGGMGFVYKARQPKLDRFVALKILAQPLAEQTSFAERFTREGRTLARLNHPNIVTIHDFGQAGPFFYLLMEYVDGVNLRQAMKAGAITSDQALAIVPRICDALQYAHNEGVLHRDIKPDNILLDTRGRVKIADFGIAKLIAEAVAENPLTGSGATLGTPHYMAPEQIEKPNAVDHRADIFSLGVVFYEMLTGELPLGRFGPPSEKSGADPRLDEVVFQTLEKHPDRRPQSADEVRTRVETITSAPGESTKSAGEVTFKMSPCYLTSPAFVRSRIGRLLRFTARGELRLDHESLTFTPRGNWIVMPLRAITGLTIGVIPAGFAQLKYIAVTFTEKGQQHRVFLVPCRSGFQSKARTNQQVEEWFAAIQNAVKARTGRIPPSSIEDCQSLPEESRSVPTTAAVVMKGVFTALALFALIMVAMYLSYALLFERLSHRAENVREPGATIEQNQPQLTFPAGGRLMDLLALTAENNNITLHTSTEPNAFERFVPMIRYGNGPWGEADNVLTTLDYRRGPNGASHEGIYMWTMPEGFNFAKTPRYEIAEAIVRTRALFAERGVKVYTNFVGPLLQITNASGQMIALGLLARRTNVTVATNPAAILHKFSAGSQTKDGGPKLYAQSQPEISPGYRVEAVGNFEGRELPTLTYGSGAFLTHVWDLPEELKGSSYQNMKVPLPERLEVKFGKRLPIFTVGAFTAYLELVPMPGVTPPPVPADGETIDYGNAARKVIEFSSVTNSDDYIVLRSDTPVKPGETVTAMVTDVHGKEDRAISGLTVRTTGKETLTSLQLMWKKPETEPTNWIETTMARIATNLLHKRISLPEGQIIKVFQMRDDGSQESAGVRFMQSPQVSPDAVANVRVRSVYPMDGGLILQFDAEVPTGCRLEAECDPQSSGEGRLDWSEISSADHFHAIWSFAGPRKPTRAEIDEVTKPALEAIKSRNTPIRVGESWVAFPFNTPSGVVRAKLRLVGADGQRERTEKSNVLLSPQGTEKQGSTKAQPDLKPRETVEVTLLKPKPGGASKSEPGRLDFDGIVDLNLDRVIYAVSRGLPTNSTTVNAGYVDVRWVCTGFEKANRVIKLAWRFPESFGMQSDLMPAVARYWGADERKNISIELDRPTRLFIVTNALGQEVACELEFKRQAPEVKDERAGVIVAGAQQDATTNGLALNIFVRFPSGVQIIASGDENGKRLPAILSRSMSVPNSMSCIWPLPETFALKGNVTNNTVSIKTGNNRTLFDDLAQLVRAGDARITAEKPLEVFALTNAEGKVFRGLLELGHARR